MTGKRRWDWSKDKFFSTDSVLRDIFTVDEVAFDPDFLLPRRHKDSFETELRELFEKYEQKLKAVIGARSFIKGSPYEQIPWKRSGRIGEGILDSLRHLHNGYPGEAYNAFERMMSELSSEVPLPHVKDTIWPNYSVEHGGQSSFVKSSRNPVTSNAAMTNYFYRVRKISDGSAYARNAIFHTPANLREKISTARYSIAGYPSLYLADTLALSMQELGSPYHSIAACFTLANRFEEMSNVLVIDLGIRPQDYIFKQKVNNLGDLHKLDAWYTSRYVFWFPLLAACSFIRENPTSSYSDEYAIPQLLMQWLRLNKKPPYGMKYPDSSTGVKEPPPPSSDGASGGGHSLLQTDWNFDILQEILVDTALTLDVSDNLEEPNDSEELDAYDRIRTIKLVNTIRYYILSLVKLTLNTPGFIFPEFYYTLLRLNSRSIDYLIGLIKLEKKGEPTNLTSRIHLILSQLEECSTLLKEVRSRQEDEPTDPLNESDFVKQIYDSFQYINRLIGWLDDYRIMGIRYFSCKDLYAPLLGRNYVFPSERISLDANGNVTEEHDAQFSTQLNRLFVWSAPQHREDYKDVQAWQDALDEELRRNPGNLNTAEG